jgi:hypothetical protein
LSYHALQASIQQRLSNGLTFNVNYTFSKSLGTINGFRSAYIGEKNLSTTDIPHAWNAFYSYDLPFGKGRKYDTDNDVLRAVDQWVADLRYYAVCDGNTARTFHGHLQRAAGGHLLGQLQSGIYRDR